MTLRDGSGRRASTTKVCKNHPTRKAPYPGPRCYSCHNERRREVRLRNHGRRVATVYGITPEQYEKLLAFQGGKCAICRRAGDGAAPGARRGAKRLAVDHDHACCPGPTSQGCCARGLCCSICNDVLAHFRDDPDQLERAAAYLRDWPSRRAGIVPPKIV